MVAYCCVKGCSNNSSNKKKNPNDLISFHAFPSNVEIKQKWLRAIGRPDWTPPRYARVCSGHFTYEQINHDGRRIRMKDDAVPIKDLPVNSNFEASDVEVCRFCLAVDVRLHSLQHSIYRLYMESLQGYNENYNIEGLPQFICYECAALLKKCYSLLEKSLTVQATLLDIFSKYGKITINLINTINRKELNLSSSLTIHETKTYRFKHKHDIETSEAPTADSENEQKAENLYVSIPKLEVSDIVLNPEDRKETENCESMLSICDEDGNLKDDKSDSSDYSFSNPADLSSEDEVNSKSVLHEDPVPIKHRKAVKVSEHEGLTPDEVNMQEYFNIVRLTFEEQVKEWRETKEVKKLSGESFKCQICSKVYAHHSSYKLHVENHDPSRGKAECPVCKMRFKNDVLARSHANRAHGKKFCCKLCPKTFSNVSVAKKHHKRHAGHTYACASCPFTTAHASSLGAHARARHVGGHACARCGRAFVSARGLKLHVGTVHRVQAVNNEDPEANPKYSCQQCNLKFISEGAKRVHILTSKSHKKKTGLCDTTPQDQSLKNSCNKCGLEFPNLRALVEHGREEHRRTKKKTSWRLPDDSYPTQCEHCDVRVGSRAEHWRHVRRAHPAQRAAYRAVVTAVCHRCGKGFQNSTKLRLHVLRHSAPSVPCPRCARMFHDKYALARHEAAHAPTRPHRCARCPRAFKQKANLARHERVHTGATPYECSLCGKKFKYSTSMNLHVKTVHYKLPHPPRKRKNKNSDEYGVI